MANCFGEVVNNCKLDQMVRYVGKPKTQEDRAREAWNLMNEDKKNEKAYRYVHGVQAWYDEAKHSTLCVVYNATGDTLYYVTDHDWCGNLGRTPYPTEIGNGQWAAFHHMHPSSVRAGSQAAVVYRAKNRDGIDLDCVLAWSTPYVWPRNKIDTSDMEENAYWPRLWGPLTYFYH
ncbi:hypothetical protein ACQ4PT_013288 [Festuca glaucescens]